MKTLLKNIFLLITLLVFLSSFSYAHFLKTDGNIGAVIHIDPDDSPVAKSISKIYIEFSDKTGNFDIDQCDCYAEIKDANNNSLFKSNLSSSNSNSLERPSFQYTFNNLGVYKLLIYGQPKNEIKFEGFTLNYDLRVDKVSESPDIKDSKVLLFFSLPIFITFFIIFFIIKKYKK